MITRRVTIKYRSELERPVSWVALVGFMGSGKSRIGAELSRKLHLNFIDTDRVIERVSCMRIPDIFELYGEATFRDYESEIVRRSCRLDDAIVSTGGGTVVRPKNREALKERGPVVLLTASAETTFQRTRRHKRPLLEVGNPIERINDLMAARKGFYEDVASFAVSTDGRPSFEVVDEIIQKLYEWQQEQQQLEMLKAGEQEQKALQQAQPQEIPNYFEHQYTDLTQQVSQEKEIVLSQTSVLHIETQQVFVENSGMNTNHLSDQQFSDQFLTESNASREAECLADDASKNEQAESSGGETFETTQVSSKERFAAEVSQQQAESLENKDPKEKMENNTQDVPEEKQSIDIYAEMIRDLMRDRGA